ncbi:hypothetical protein F5ESL0263_06715 [Lactobacillus sp. ESL0263]|uniref:hypothetical protein n=1 Tax=Lactobacillus sp. ESL0263 TaxID=2069350 RepID=UPI000EFC518E|nr:hypothetical protein [Lactobacillus sp. ESL0263]RMC48296.1 hypothetical protein F5ESL0263_06715 [Lactobacillus sp. ESL0263]
MKRTVKDIDNGLITASLKSENLLRAIELMLEKLHSIQGAENMTLADYQKIYGLADLMRVYACNLRDEISHTESLINFEEE